MDVIIRSARKDDLSTLLEFEQGVIDAERPMDVDLKIDHINYYNIEALIESAQCELAVAEIGGIIVGSGYAKIMDAKSWHTFDRYAYLGFMYTLPNYRGKGINPMLVNYLKDWCRSKGVMNLALEVYHNNPGAIRAYEKVGFEPRLVEMRIQLK